MGRKWTQEELNYLEESWGTLSMAAIAKQLNRTETAVQGRASRDGLGNFLNAGDYITLNMIYIALRGKSQGGYTLRQWKEKGLPVQKKKVKNNSFQVVNLEEFWKWAKKNRTIIDFSRLEEKIFGKEPDWLIEQRRADKEMAKFNKGRWSEVEDRQLINMLKAFKYSYTEIAQRLQRTEGAIKRRMVHLQVKERPIKADNHIPWEQKEIEKIVELFNKGYQPDAMVSYINRSSQAIRGKIERMIKEGQLMPRSKYRKSC